MANAPICPYCGKTAELVSSTYIYNGQDYGLVWCCPDYPKCDSFVGVHKHNNEPLGRMANRDLRTWKKRAHAAFDPLWQVGDNSRSKMYAWLAEQMGIEPDKCHIGLFNIGQCQHVVMICDAKRKELT